MKPELWVARAGDIAVEKLAFTNLDPIHTRRSHFLESGADVRNLLSTLSTRRGHDHLGAIQTKARRQLGVQEPPPVEGDPRVLGVEDRVAPIAALRFYDLETTDPLAGWQ